MKTDYKLGDRVRVIRDRSNILEDGYIGFVEELKLNVDSCIVDGSFMMFEEIELVESVEDIAIEYDHINPDHYKKGSVEVFDMMVSIYGKDKAKVFCELNAFKYRMRLGSKPNNSIEQELEKIKWYESKLKELC